MPARTAISSIDAIFNMFRKINGLLILGASAMLNAQNTVKFSDIAVHDCHAPEKIPSRCITGSRRRANPPKLRINL